MNAPEKATEIKAGITAGIAFLTALWGWWGWLAWLWIIMIFMDYVTGSMAAKKSREWSSAIAREGLWHKAGEIFAVLVSALCDIALQVVGEGSGIQLPFEIGPVITPVVLTWYILTEVGSILENCGKLGAPVPSWFKKRVSDYKEAIDHDQGETALPEIAGEPVGKHEKTERQPMTETDKPPDEENMREDPGEKKLSWDPDGVI